MNSTVLSGDSLKSSKEKFFGDLLLFNSSINNNKLSVVGHNSMLSVGWADCVSAFIETFKENESSVKNLVLSSLATLSKVCPHAIELYLRTLCEESTEFESTFAGTRTGSKAIIDDAITNTHDEYILSNKKNLIDAVQMAGALGNVSVKVRGDITESRVTLEEGFTAGCRLDDFFVEHLSSVNYNKCKIVLVNGKVIDVGEIHHILHDSYETKQQYLLITTGLSEDVSNTLFVNWQSGKTRVIPFHVVDGIDNINEIKDLSVVCGVQPCSLETGQLVSALKIEDIPLSQINFDAGKQRLKIIPPETSLLAIQKLTAEIRKKLNSCKVEDVKDLLNSRLAKLHTRTALLEVPGDFRARGMIEDKFNSFFSHISSCASQGIVDARENFFPDYHVNFLPSSYAQLAIKRAVSDRNVISNIRTVIKLETE